MTAPLADTPHARRRWFRRAPRMLRTAGAWADARQYARYHATRADGTEIWIASGMRLLVREGHVITCLPVTWPLGADGED